MGKPPTHIKTGHTWKFRPETEIPKEKVN